MTGCAAPIVHGTAHADPPKRQRSANVCTLDLAQVRRCSYIVDNIILTLVSLGTAIAP
jgi:hypothetical protein